MARERRRPARGSRRRNRREEKARKQLYQRSAVSAAAVMMAVGIGYVAMAQMTAVRPGEDGCLPELSAHTVMLVDTSVVTSDQAQKRAVLSSFEEVFAALLPGERWTVITTERGHYDAVGGNRFTLCKPDFESSSPTYVDKVTKELYAETVSEPITEIVESFTNEDKRSRQSPLLEILQSTSQRPDFSARLGSRRLVLVSDMIQNTQIAQFCTTQGHLPSYPKFKALPAFANIQPDSLQGVDVTLFMQVYPGAYGHPEGLPYCTENELREFWEAYFKDAGAASVTIRRIEWSAV
ncbi:MAG: hypothetical protein AAF950_18490 [Pseudomonadota bacterium]